MRAISIAISTDSGAGGFILPNDRIDLILTRKSAGDHVNSSTILTDVRVLAVDQTFKQEKDTKTVIGKTATLEVTPGQAEQVARAQTQGTLSLSLRPLTSTDTPIASNAPIRAMSGGSGNGDSTGDPVGIIRYGISHDASGIVQAGAPK
jgi:pilus assembly protein CpaB